MFHEKSVSGQQHFKDETSGEEENTNLIKVLYFWNNSMHVMWYNNLSDA